MPARTVTHDDTGIKVLFHEYQGNDPTIDPNKYKTVDILAVHGLGAHPDETWEAKRTTAGTAETVEGSRWVNWLQENDMLPAEFPNARIMRHGYKSAWFGTDSVRQSVSSAALQLLMSLKRKRRFCLDRPLIIIAHSFGGLVVLRALCDAYEDTEKWPKIFEATKGLIFLGTPFRGASGMEQSVMIQAAYRELAEFDVEKQALDVLQPGNYVLRDLVDRFGKYWSRNKDDPIVCFYELQASEIGKIIGGQRYKSFVVNEEAGCLDLSKRTSKHPLGRTHFNMNKFARPTEDDYLAVVDFLTDMVPTANSILQEHRPMRDRLPSQPVQKPDPPVTPTLLQRLTMTTEIRSLSQFDHQSGVLALNFSPDGSLLASAAEDGTVRFRDVRRKREVKKLQLPCKLITATFSADNSHLATFSSDSKSIRIWEVDTVRELHQQTIGRSHVCAMEFSHDGLLIWRANSAFEESGLVQVWKAGRGGRETQLETIKRGVYCVGFSPNGSLIAAVTGSASVQSVLEILAANTGHTLKRLTLKHLEYIHTIVFSHDASLMATAPRNGMPRLWDVENGHVVAELEDCNRVYNLQFSFDMSTVVCSTTSDSEVRVYDAKTGRRVHQLNGGNDFQSLFTFSPDNTHLACADGHEDICLWDLTDDTNL